MLRLSLTLGPLLAIVGQMFAEISLFLALWCFEVAVGFGFIHMFTGTSLSYTRTIEILISGQVVDQYADNRLPMVLLTLFGVLNLVVFANCLIAVLNESYIRLKSKGQAMYILTLFEALPGLLFDKE